MWSVKIPVVDTNVKPDIQNKKAWYTKQKRDELAHNMKFCITEVAITVEH